MIRFNENQIIDAYKVIYFIKETLFCSSYRVSDANGTHRFMKVFDLSVMDDCIISEGTPKEILIYRQLEHKNIVSFVDSGDFFFQNKRYAFLITEFFTGLLLSDIRAYNDILTVDDKIEVAIGIAEGAKSLQAKLNMSHNDITPRNIVLTEDAESKRLIPKLFDFGHSSFRCDGNPPFLEIDLDAEYCAPETFRGYYSEKSDVFSIAAVLYTMLFGVAPWHVDKLDKLSRFEKIQELNYARKKDLVCNREGIPSPIAVLLDYALALDPSSRISMDVLIKSLKNRGININDLPEFNETSRMSLIENEETPESIFSNSAQKTGKGFADVAGMDQLKKELLDRVIWVLKDREKAELYRLTPPNGMILYGPPGCGKTYFAEKFSEESGFKFRILSGSDLGDSLLHETQKNIANLFKEAAEQAPIILCFDEFDAFVPKRGSIEGRYQSDEVNEFLSQLNNCSKRGIFVIGTTNRIDLIDPAVLRKGRMDLKFYVPAPDYDTRIAMFKLHLNNRPLGDDIDYEALATSTDNYASSDIAALANEAALMAALANEPIRQYHIMNAIKCNPSSLEESYTERTKIGF